VSQRDKILVALATTVVALVGGWFFLAKPKRADMRALDAQITAQRSQLAGASATAAQYRAARDQLRRNPQAFRQANKALPNRVAMSDLLRTLTRTADRAGVTMSDVTTSAGTATTPGISGVNLSLNFTGSFLELQRFFAQLQKFVKVSSQKVAAKGRLLALDDLSLNADAGTLKAKVNATAYILQPGALATGATATTATATPATTPTTTGAAQP
jgi:Tfp pilus assembly protein PilO